LLDVIKICETEKSSFSTIHHWEKWWEDEEGKRTQNGRILWGEKCRTIHLMLGRAGDEAENFLVCLPSSSSSALEKRSENSIEIVTLLQKLFLFQFIDNSSSNSN